MATVRAARATANTWSPTLMMPMAGTGSSGVDARALAISGCRPTVPGPMMSNVAASPSMTVKVWCPAASITVTSFMPIES